MAAIHETMEALHDVGAIDKQTMRCLPALRRPGPLKPEKIKPIRKREFVSQTVFAHYVSGTSSLVSKCERGEKRPFGQAVLMVAARLLAEGRGSPRRPSWRGRDS
jgi:putative transcriptional regulator